MSMNLKLKISKPLSNLDSFLVEDLSQPGCPPVGRGRTMIQAIGDFFHRNQLTLGITFDVDPSALPAEMRRRERELQTR